tara:strand:+ start:842 stop:1294 length:453 start_codon:yes stop_codon:yes gene_type:complete
LENIRAEAPGVDDKKRIVMNKKIYDHILKLTNTAKDICLNDRHKTHGDVAENHRTIAAFWSSYLSIAIKPSQVAAMLALVKLSRVKNGMVYNEDNFVDATSYVAIAGALRADELDILKETVKHPMFTEDAPTFTGDDIIPEVDDPPPDEN